MDRLPPRKTWLPIPLGWLTSLWPRITHYFGFKRKICQVERASKYRFIIHRKTPGITCPALLSSQSGETVVALEAGDCLIQFNIGVKWTLGVTIYGPLKVADCLKRVVLLLKWIPMITKYWPLKAGGGLIQAILLLKWTFGIKILTRVWLNGWNSRRVENMNK